MRYAVDYLKRENGTVTIARVFFDNEEDAIKFSDVVDGRITSFRRGVL